MACSSFSKSASCSRAHASAGDARCPVLSGKACPVITMPTPHLETISCICLRQWLSGSVTLMAALSSHSPGRGS